MGRPIRTQRLGKGMPRYLATKNSTADVNYISLDAKQMTDKIGGEILDLVMDVGRSGILAKIAFDNGKIGWQIAAEGNYVGQKIYYGLKADRVAGNVSQLKSLIEGTPIFNIEGKLGDGGKFARASGAFAIITAKDLQQAFVKMPSGKVVVFPLNVRATIGNAAAGERPEKPLVKAGNAHYKFKVKHKRYHKNRGVKMNPVDHPFGGVSHKPGKSKSTSRNAPPGRKVGAIASSRTGRRKKS